MEEFPNNPPQKAKKEENKIEKPQIKEGVDLIFKQNPELANIGTMEQYSEYLDTIFPGSKVKDIFYHAGHNKFLEFKDPSSSGLSHIWFSQKPLLGQFGGNIYRVLLNIENPLNEYTSENYLKELKYYETPINPDWINNYHLTGELPKYKYDGTIRSSRVDEGSSITVRNPKQIYILGSEQDIENFKKFTKQGTQKELNTDLHNEDYIRRVFASGNEKDIESLAAYHHLTPEEVRLFSYFAKLRQKTLDEMRLQIAARRQERPIATEDELNMGAYQESIEPQVRPTVLNLRKKGYATYGSGFSGFDSQGIYFEKNCLKNFQLPEKIINEFKNKGVLIEINDDRIKLTFKKEASREEIESLWQEVGNYFPDLGEPSPPCQLKQAILFRERQKGLTA